MESRRFDLPGTRLRIQSRSGKVLVVAEKRDDVDVETDEVEGFIQDEGTTLAVRSSRGGSKPITVRCPIDTDVNVGTQSASVRLEGKFGGVHVTTMSGSIELDRAEDGDLRTMSGNITVGTCFGECRMSTVSGSASLQESDTARASTVSGTIKLRHVGGDVRARSVSGSVELGSDGDGSIAIKTVSGKISIAVPQGTAPRTRFKTRGRVNMACPSGNDCMIDAASLSGSIDVVPA
jgi:DUF4097 and DUF4098 domain-containing protein YvlB